MRNRYWKENISLCMQQGLLSKLYAIAASAGKQAGKQALAVVESAGSEREVVESFLKSFEGRWCEHEELSKAEKDRWQIILRKAKAKAKGGGGEKASMREPFLQRALLTLQVNPGSRYRCGKRD